MTPTPASKPVTMVLKMCALVERRRSMPNCCLVTFDEVNWLTTSGNQSIDPKIDCFKGVPDFSPASTLTESAATPPSDGFFDATASYIGAFEVGDAWATGNWVDYCRD